MTEETFWKLFSGLGLIIGFLAKALVDSFRKESKDKIYICPLDKSGLKSDMVRISSDLDKAETKLNKITSITEYNKTFIENIHAHYGTIAQSLSKLVNLQEQSLKALEKISKNGN